MEIIQLKTPTKKCNLISISPAKVAFMCAMTKLPKKKIQI